MNTILLGAAGFIGTNLILALTQDPNNSITAVDRDKVFFKHLDRFNLTNFHIVQSNLTMETDYEELVKGQDIVYHLISTTVPSTSNQAISEEL